MNPNLSPTPPRATPGHRRAHSDTSFRFSDDLDDDFLFDIDNFNISSLDIPPSPPPVPAKSEESSGGGGGGGGGGADTGSSSRIQTPSHLRSLSVDADFFDGLSFAGDGEGGGVRKHRRTNSMDGGGGSFSSMMDMESCVDGVKKAMPPERLAELALIDPKRAKRILANRQSAARSKERKIKYTSELERKVQTLQTEATTLSAQVTLLQRDTSGLSVENKELKLRLKSLEQQAQLRDALNEALRQEVQRLRLATGQIPSGSSHPSSRGIPPQFSMQLQNLPHFGSQQNQQQPHAQHQFQPRQQQSTQSQNLPPFGGPQNQQQSQQQSQQQPQLQPRQQQSPQLQNIPPFGGQQNQQQSQQQPRLQQLLQQQQFQLPNQPPSGHQQLKPNFMDFNHRV